MSAIQDDINAIRRAVYGKDVREAIADGIEQCYTDVSSAATLADTAASNANTAAIAASAAAEMIPEDYTELIDTTNTLTNDLNSEIARASAAENSLSGRATSLENRTTSLETVVDTLNQGGLVIEDEVIANNVQSWLNAHPEATTSVEDGSITQAKFANELTLKAIKDYVTPEMFGAVGDGTTDDTQSLQDAIDYGFTNKKEVHLTQKYAITQSLTIQGVSSTTTGKGAQIIGNGYARIIAKAAISSILEFSPATDTRAYGITIKDIYLDGNNNATNGINSAYAVAGCVFENITISQCTNGLHINKNCYYNNFRVIRMYHCTSYGILLENGTNTSNIFEKCYVDTCENAYRITGIYSTMISCCADVISGTVFDLVSFSGALIGCGSESKTFTCMIRAANNSNAILCGGYYFGNPTLANYYFVLETASRISIHNCRINYMTADSSSGALYSMGASCRLNLQETVIYRPFNGTNHANGSAITRINTAVETKTLDVTLDENNEATLTGISAASYSILDAYSSNQSGWRIIPYRSSSTAWKVKVCSSNEYFPTISDKNFTLVVRYVKLSGI